ncbi:MAG TPA: metallophosphoesterase, partial [Roseimicrobium sp.]|nr:metallophosphoesterase [Roseimicrobium sp.]
AASGDSFALFSDPHVAADPATALRGVTMAENLRLAVKDVLSLERRPGGLLVNGDCAMLKGEAGDYLTFGGLVKPIRESGIPVHLTLGNHDDRGEFLKAFSDSIPAEHPVSEKHVAVVESPKANWFLLDTLEAVNKTPGLLGEQQLGWLEKALDKRKGKPAIVVCHHNPQRGETKSGIKDSDRLFEITESRKYVKAIIYGHTHVWSVTQEPSGLHLINLPPVAYVFKDGLPNGWVSALVREDGLNLELRCLDARHPLNGEKRDLKWRKA